MTRTPSEPARAAAAIRAQLKARGIPARVTSRLFSMGSEVRVCITDESPERVREIAELCEPYEFGTFDPMTDCSGVKNLDNGLPHAKYVSVENARSDAMSQACWDHAREYFHALHDAPRDFRAAGPFWCSTHGTWGNTVIDMVFCGRTGQFWETAYVT